MDGDLRAIFDDLNEAEDGAAHETRPAAELIRRHERQLMATVFRWTGHFPEKTRSLVRNLAKRAEALKQVYPRDAEDEARRRRHDARHVARDELRPSRLLFSGDAVAEPGARAGVGARVAVDAGVDAVGADCQRCR